jgi:hypothetical protein
MRSLTILSFSFAAAIATASFVVGGCSSSDATAIPPASDGGTVPPNDAGASRDGAGAPLDDGGLPGKPPANACKITPVGGALPVTATFKNLAPPDVQPTPMKGGAPTGRWKAIKATNFLPKETAQFIDPTKATGTLTGWVVFEGSSYRLRLLIDFTVKTALGDQVQKNDVDTQGTFTTAGEKLTLSPVCDAPGSAGGQTPEYTYTADNGALRLVIKTRIAQVNADTYVEIEAVPE